jgi:excisionase family DNA binding protein
MTPERTRGVSVEPCAHAPAREAAARLNVELPAELVEAIAVRAAVRAAEMVLAQLEASAPASPYLTIPEAAELLRCSRQRVDDLLSQRRLTRFKDGTRTLVSRAEIDAYVSANGVAPALPPAPQSRSTSAIRRAARS